MNARNDIASILWGSVPSSTDEEAKGTADRMLDAYRLEVIADRDAQIIEWLEEKAREEGTSNKERRTRADAIARMADKLSRGAVRPPLSKGPDPKPEADFTQTLDPHDGVVSVTNISDRVRNKLHAEGLAEAADIADQMQGSRHIVQELRLRAREVADQ